MTEYQITSGIPVPPPRATRAPSSTAQPVRFEICPSGPISFHPFSNLFPMMTGEAQDTLRADIRQNGVREPIVMLDGAILDGRNRFMAARDLGLPYPRREFDGDDPLAYVISLNLARRHLNESERALVAAKLANMPQGARTDLASSANLQKVSRADAAEMLNVSTRSVASAKHVQEAAPELVPDIEAGNLSVSLAVQVAELSPELRAAVVAAAPAETRDVAREAVKRRAKVTYNSGNDQWNTPPKWLERVHQALGGIDLDPASSEFANKRVKAAQIFTLNDDALAEGKVWPVGRLFMNPPFDKENLPKFAERFINEIIMRGSTGIVLVNNCTDTVWGNALLRHASAVCFPLGRIKFLNKEGKEQDSPTQGQMFLYFGPDVARFREIFEEHGEVLVPAGDAPAAERAAYPQERNDIWDTVSLQASEELAELLLAKLDASALPMLISLLEAARPQAVVGALIRALEGGEA